MHMLQAIEQSYELNFSYTFTLECLFWKWKEFYIYFCDLHEGRLKYIYQLMKLQQQSQALKESHWGQIHSEVKVCSLYITNFS